MIKAKPSTETDRVRRNTGLDALKKIDRQIEENIRHYSGQPISVITNRIEELEREWSIERWLQTNASALAFTGTFLGMAVSKKWFALTLLVTGFLFQHSVQGWCPPLPVLRRMGVRTRGEIDREKFALKALRGDFKDLGAPALEHSHQIERILAAARA
jgi:hypothetical protein